MNRYMPVLVIILALGLASGGGWAFGQVLNPQTPTQNATTIALDLNRPVALPALDASEGWELRIRVQNLSATATHAVLIAYAGSTGECPADGAPAMALLCSGLIKPGLTWTWTHAALPPATSSAFVRAWSACPGNQGSPVDLPLAVEVERTRVIDAETRAVSAYVGQTNWGGPDPLTGKYVYLAPWLTAGNGEFSTLSLQNMGLTCADIQIDYWPQAACLPGTTTRIPTLAPAQSIRLDTDVGQPTFKGAAFIYSSQPLGVLIDHWKPSSNEFSTFAAVPGGVAAGFAPLAYRASQGWDASIHIQNVMPTGEVNPAITFYSFSGETHSTTYPRLCAGDSDSIQLKNDLTLPASMMAVQAVRAVAVVELENETRGQAMAYTAVIDPLAVAGKVIGVPRLIKTVAATSRVAIQNLNTNPGETIFAIELYDGERLVDFLIERLEAGQSMVFTLSSLNYIPPGWQGSAIIRIMDNSTQTGYPALNVVLTEQHLSGKGDRSLAYEGVVVPMPLPPTTTPTSRPSATPTATVTDTPGPTNTPLPPGTPSATPTMTTSPTPTTTPTPIATFPPTPTPTPRLVEMTILAPVNMTGYVRSNETLTAHLNERHIYVGMDTNRVTPLTFHGITQFDLSSIPDGVKLRRASIELVGQSTEYLSPNAGGQWRVHLLDQAVDGNWTRLGYWHIHYSPIRATLSPTLTDEDLGEGLTNRLDFSTSQLSALEERLSSTRRASFRIDGAPSAARVRHIFDWSMGNALGPTQYPQPTLKIVYEMP